MKGGTNPAILIDEGVQSVRIGGFQLGQLSVLQDQLDDRILQTELLQHLRRGGITCLRLFPVGQPLFLKKDHAQLFGRIDVELLTCIGINLLLQFIDTAPQPLAVCPKLLPFDPDPVAFHIRQHKYQRHLNLIKQLI